jgi:hypothetical protein
MRVTPTINSQERCLSLHLVLLFSSQMLMSLPSRPWTAKTVKGPWRLPIPVPRLPASAIEQHRRMFHPTVPYCAGRADRTRHMRAFSTRGRSMKRSRSDPYHKEGISSPRRASSDSPQRRRASATSPSPSSERNRQQHPDKHQSDPKIRLSWAVGSQFPLLCHLRFRGWYGAESRVHARRRLSVDNERRMRQLQ